jgi:hypothetical protein
MDELRYCPSCEKETVQEIHIVADEFSDEHLVWRRKECKELVNFVTKT